MSARRTILLGAALVTVILVVSSMGLLAGLSGARPSATGAASVSAATSASATSPPAPPLSAAHGTPSGLPGRTSASVADTSVPYGIAEAEQEIHSGAVSPSAVLLPRAPPTSGIPAAGSPITGPSYPTTPAPMGLADFGQGAGGAYEYNTSSFASTLNLSSFQDYNPGYSAWGASPNWMTFQLNTVTVNTSYPGATNGSFWIQNVVHFNGTSLQFENNIWNFSSAAACLGYGTLLNYSGQQSGCFYYVYGPTFNVTYPMSLTLYNNLTMVSDGGRLVPGVYFNYSLSFGSTNVSSSFDFVTFNGNASASAPPQFQVNGFNYNSLGYLFYDAEIIFGGNGGGANANIVNLSGQATLDYLPTGSSTYVSVPSAYDYGGDTGETALGVAATWTGTTETLRQGPSFLYGLWNTANGTFGPASTNVTISVTLSGLPSYSFVFMTNVTDFAAANQNWSYFPSNDVGVASTLLPWMYLSNFYTFEVDANGYDASSYTLDNNVSFAVPMTPNSAVFDTPVYLSTSQQVADFGAANLTGVAYNATSGDLWINDTMSSILPMFNRLNDFLYPSFVLFAALNLTNNVAIDRFVQDPATFNYTSDGHGGGYLAGWTQGYYFNFGTGIFTVSNVSVVGNTTLYYQGIEPLAAVEFWSTADSNASNVVTGLDSFGVDVYYSTNVGLYNIVGETGANAVAILYSQGVFPVNITSVGQDSFGTPTWAIYLEASEDVFALGITAENGSLGVYLDHSGFIVLQSMNVLSGSTGIEGAFFGYVNLIGASASGGSYFGYLEDGSNLDVADLTVTSAYGLDIAFTTSLRVQDVTASGYGADGIDELYQVSQGTVLDVSASNDSAYGLFALATSYVNLTGATASLASVGAIFATSSNFTVQYVNATNYALGVAIENSQYASVTYVNTTVSALGVLLLGNSRVDLSEFNATNAAAWNSGPSYFQTAYPTGLLPVAGVQVIGDSNDTISLGHVVNYAFGVVANSTVYLVVGNLGQWNGDLGVSLQYGEYNAVVASFLYGDTVGVSATGIGNLVLDANTIEASSSFGAWIDGGNDTLGLANNFVANNGASTNGTYSSSNVQVGMTNLTAANFSATWAANYWSDWSPTAGSYVIGTNVSDTTPVSAFITNWLEFNETGLPAGTPWGFSLGGLSYPTSAQLVYIPAAYAPGATVSFTVTPPVGYTPSPASGSVTFTGTDQTVTIAFTAIEYNVTFAETGLPSGTSWSVTYDGVVQSGTSTSIEFPSTVGTFDYSVPNAAGYVPSHSSGTVTVSGTDVTVDLQFTLPMFAVAFTQSTLPSGTPWSVTLNGQLLSSMSNSIQFTEANGSYAYSVGAVAGYTAAPSGGTLTVQGATSQVVTFTAVPVTTYAVTFAETGLPSGTNWSVSLNGATEYAVTSTISFEMPNGSYAYTVGPVAGYTSQPASGNVAVTGAATSVSVGFAAKPLPTYTVTFTESGLPSGTSWSVTLNGTTRTTTTSAISFSVVNGTYSFSIGSVSGYTSSSTPVSSLTVSGAAVPVSVTFTSNSPPSPSGSSGLSTLDWIIIGVIVALIIVGLIVGLAMRGRGGSGSKGSGAPKTESSTPESGGESPPETENEGGSS